MTVYAVASTKGGVGKTSTALHLATMLAKQGNTLLIDGDPQASAAKWAGWRRDTTFEPSPVTTRLNGKESRRRPVVSLQSRDLRQVACLPFWGATVVRLRVVPRTGQGF